MGKDDGGFVRPSQANGLGSARVSRATPITLVRPALFGGRPLGAKAGVGPYAQLGKARFGFRFAT